MPVNSTLSGATPLVRAQTVQYMEETESIQYMDSCNVNPQLPSTDQAAIRNLLDEFSHVFAQNPKRPEKLKQRISACQYVKNIKRKQRFIHQEGSSSLKYFLLDCNSQATFQRLIDETMRKAKHTECYVDDCLTNSPDINGHLGDLRIALRCLEKAGIQLRHDKCKFGYNECEFLGHRISGEGRTPTQSYTERISKFPVPKSAAELQRFLGTVGYYRCYIPILAAVASPLYS